MTEAQKRMQRRLDSESKNTSVMSQADFEKKYGKLSDYAPKKPAKKPAKKK